VTVEVEKEVEKIVTVEVAKEAMPTCSMLVAEQIAREKYAGETLNVTWESGLQADGPLNFSSPEWEKRTGVKVNIIPLASGPENYSKQLTEHIAGTGAFDVLNVWPMWNADYVLSGVVEPLDDFIEQYMNPADLEDMIELYRDMGKFEGKTYGLFDDGDVIIIYYRKDLFEEHGDEFADRFGHALAPAANWKEFDEIAMFFTEKFAPDLYGAGFPRGFVWNPQPFHIHFKAIGGRFFDPDTMDPLVNGPEGVQAVSEMAASNQWMPPGITEMDAPGTLFEYLAGKYAMTWGWPPWGRWSAGYGTQTAQMAWVPESQVDEGRTGYSMWPGDYSHHAAGFNLAVSADSPRKELAYLYIQWMTSPEISLQRVMLPYALRDPYRISHFESTLYSQLWPEAPEYLDTLLEAAEKASLDIFMPGAQEYHEAIDRAITSVYAGTDAQEAMDSAANEMAEVTERLGVDRQKQAYANYVKMKGAYPPATLKGEPTNLDLYG
jgi:multiple sugar transport system substrate-binding protein